MTITQFIRKGGPLKVVAATSAFGLGLDASDVQSVYHWSPLNTIAEYIQETVRSGRDGRYASSRTGTDFSGLMHPNDSMKRYCKYVNSICRRQILMEAFVESPVLATIQKPHPEHLCCDICAASCTCVECSTWSISDMHTGTTESNNQVDVDLEIRSLIESKLRVYREELCITDSLVFSLKVSTGISDSSIVKVASMVLSILEPTDLIELGIPTEHVLPILSLLHTCM